MKITVLLSCMYQNDMSIVTRTNIQSDAVVINQCDKDEVKAYTFINRNGQECQVRFISTTERGLSKSRNMAIRNAGTELCLICDDDEVLDDNYVQTIADAFKKNTEDILAFQLKHPTRIYKSYTYRIGFFKSGSIGSCQLAFRREKVVSQNITFNEKMGSGTGNGAGEENKFVMDCYKKGLRIRYIPKRIGALEPTGESQWFHGYDQEFWMNKGWASKMIYGRFFGYIYLWYTIVKHNYDTINPISSKIKWLHKGYFLKR